jgi:chromate reductase, NAD(P)H dehydrogenase (quinone)
LTGKPCAVIGASPGKTGTALAQQQLRSVLGYCDSPQLGKEAFIQFTPGLISDDGEIAEASTQRFLREFMEAFAVFIGRVVTSRPSG